MRKSRQEMAEEQEKYVVRLFQLASDGQVALRTWVKIALEEGADLEKVVRREREALEEELRDTQDDLAQLKKIEEAVIETKRQLQK